VSPQIAKKALKCSPCCDDKIYASLGDGVLVGSCAKCGKDVIRKNPRTGKIELLNGESAWTTEDAAQQTREGSEP
jgi:hypothetical protein